MHHRSEGVAIGTLDAFYLMRCYGHVSPEDIVASTGCVDVLAAHRPEGCSAIIAIDPSSAFPSEETRRAALDMTRKTSVNTAAQTVIVLGDGFWASAIRGVLTTLGSLSQTTYPRKIVRYEPEGVDFAIEAIGESLSKYRAPLLAALTQLRSASSSPPPSSKPSPSTSKVPPSSKRRAG